MTGVVRIGVGGWSYAPWDESFYPPKWPKKKQLEYAVTKLTATEVNATFYARQKPATFAAWAKTAPDGFQFALKGSRYVTNRRVLADAGEGIANFLGQGLVELGDRLGPINWQLAGTKKFDAEDIEGFFKLLPDRFAGLTIRHAIEPRHASFDCEDFRTLAAKYNVAVVHGVAEDYPTIPCDSGGFSYLRLQQCREEIGCGYDDAALDGIAGEVKARAERGDVYVFFISGAKVRAPAAAMALIGRV